MKFNSDRLKECNFKIKTLTLNQARANGEVIQIADSELVRTLHRIKRVEFNQVGLNDLLSLRKKIQKKKNSKNSREEFLEITKKIDNILFIPEIISIKFQDKRHFRNIVDKGGVQINGESYVFFMASAGQTRRDTALFINQKIKAKITEIFENGRNKQVELVPAKYQAYFSLYSSSSLPIRFPRIAIVKDVIIKSNKRVDFSYYISPKEDPIFKDEIREFEFNGADGQGIMSPEFAEMMSADLQIDYIPSSAIIRAPFIKGLLVTFDFREFVKQKIGDEAELLDIYGNKLDLNNVDCLISESQFKLYSAYSSTEEYVSKCIENNLGFGVSRVAPKKDKSFAQSSYQFLQVLNLDDEGIKGITEPTLNWFRDISGGDILKSILFLSGKNQFEEGWFENLSPLLKAVLLENSIGNDSYFINQLESSISKKKNDGKFGRLIFEGNYQFAIADPYTQMARIMSTDVKPLLEDGEHYSKYWIDKKIERVVCVRSPIVHASEVTTLNFKNTDETNDWYRYINSGIVFPLYGISMDFARLGGSDVDGDSVCTIHNESFLNGQVKETLPIMYETKKAEKFLITEDTENLLVEAQIAQVKTNKIGYYTNLGSAMYALLYDFKEGTKEYNKILNRLKYFRVLQGNLIDKTKGITVDPALLYWDKYIRTTDGMNEDEIKEIYMNNSTLGNKRPYFMKYLYAHFRKKYNDELSNYNNISLTKFGIPFLELIEMPHLNGEQEKLVMTYKKKTFFMDNNSPMNRICHHMEKELSNIHLSGLKESKKFDMSVLLSENFRKPLKRDVDKIHLLYKEYKSLKRSLRESQSENSDKQFSTIEEIYKYIYNKAHFTITSNEEEIGDLVVYLCYGVLGKQSKSFAWNCFGENIVTNIRNKKKQKYVRMPIPDPNGSLEYLFEKYAVHLINIE